MVDALCPAAPPPPPPNPPPAAGGAAPAFHWTFCERSRDACTSCDGPMLSGSGIGSVLAAQLMLLLSQYARMRALVSSGFALATTSTRGALGAAVAPVGSGVAAGAPIFPSFIWSVTTSLNIRSPADAVLDATPDVSVVIGATAKASFARRSCSLSLSGAPVATAVPSAAAAVAGVDVTGAATVGAASSLAFSSESASLRTSVSDSPVVGSGISCVTVDRWLGEGKT